ncbi:MAG: CDP-glucose 4,6-dehydratase [Casimicrobiaceae bacterium]
MSPMFWRSRRVFVTGHTGFKGSWLCLWLQRLGAVVHGYALAPPPGPSLFRSAGVGERMHCTIGDVCDLPKLRAAMEQARPEVVMHLAAQSLVRTGYDDPIQTYGTNVMGTVHVLESVRHVKGVRAVVNVTTDKCYENHEWPWGYREVDALGGVDPYSSSKACSELATAAYRRSYFPAELHDRHGVAVATARAGNVIGGGDWAKDRLIPDLLRAIAAGSSVRIRQPNAVRPWQHVLEPLSGYLMLAERLHSDGHEYAESWNFGPQDDDMRPVRWIVENVVRSWGPEARWELDSGEQPHESRYLRLDCSKARSVLGWTPRMRLIQALEWTVEWHKAHAGGADMSELSDDQIGRFEAVRPS